MNKITTQIIPKRDKILKNILQDVIANPADFEIERIKITGKIVAIKWFDEIKTKHFKKDNLEVIESLKLKLTRDSLVYRSLIETISSFRDKIERQYLLICYNHSLTDTFIELNFDGIIYMAESICRNYYNKNYIIGCDNVCFIHA